MEMNLLSHLFSLVSGRWIASLGLVILLMEQGRSVPVESTLEAVRRDCVAAYSTHAAKVTAAAAEAANLFLKSVQILAANPGISTLDDCRKAWRGARKAYLLTEPLRFSGGPIDDDDGPEQSVNPWPIQDSVIEKLLHSKDEALTPELLQRRHQVGGADEAALGFSVLAYLLWETPEPLNARRCGFLLSAAQVLRDELAGVGEEWQAGQTGNFHAMFVEEETLAIQRMITGPSLLGGGELATTRLQLPCDTQDRHDTTAAYSRDSGTEARLTVQALSAFWRCLEPYAKQVDASVAAQINGQTQRMETLSSKLPEQFFTAGGDPDKIAHQLILALEDQAASLRKLGRLLNLNIPLEVGPEGE
jgi:uncharacterized iron-regulated protein